MYLKRYSVAQTNKKCPYCKALGHSGFYCKSPLKPRKEIPRTAIKKTVKAPVKKANKLTRSQAKEKAWKAFSDYIRLRDCLATTGTPDFAICITCNERGDSSQKPYKMIQAGHAVGGRGNAVLFHEEIVNGQCSYCNSNGRFGLGGDYGNYAIVLVKRYGIEHATALQRLKGTEKQYKLHDFIEIEQEYKNKLLDL